MWLIVGSQVCDYYCNLAWLVREYWLRIAIQLALFAQYNAENKTRQLVGSWLFFELP